MFTCPSCGAEWPDNYCPACARTIDRSAMPPPETPPRGRDRPAATPLPVFAQPAPPPLPTPARPARPTVVALYRAWCGLILIVYAAFGIRDALILAGKAAPELGPIAELLSHDDPKMHEQLLAEERQNSVIGLAIACVGTVLFGTGLAYCPRAPWAWVWGIVAISVSIFPLCISLAAVVPFLIFWLKPETKRHFGLPVAGAM